MSLTTWFPNLVRGNHRITSNVDEKYNCIAWAYGVNNDWLEPNSKYSWPIERDCPDDVEPSTAHIAAIFLAQGFEPCDGEALEAGYDRVAIYGASQDRFTHVACQRDDGWWASKIGEFEDIEHETLAALEGLYYGRVARILRRSRLWNAERDPPAM